MKKNNKKETKREQEKAAAAIVSGLAQREANSLVIGIDLGDRISNYCVCTREQERIAEGTVASTPQGMADFFQGLKRQRITMETGTHARWVATLLELLGHEVIVGNSRKLKLITESNQKSDKVDARLLSRLGCTGTDWLYPVYQRREATYRDLMMVRAREVLVETRTALINHVRGAVKSFGCRISGCGGDQFAKVAKKELPAAIQGALGGVIAMLEGLQEQIREYDGQVEEACREKYPQTKWLLQVSGVGPLTALTFVLTIEDAERFERSRDVGAYLGLVAKKKQSGKRDPQLGITKTGDQMLRKLLVNCAHHILGYRGADSDLRRWGLGLVEAGRRAGKKGARSRAASAVARKLAVLLHRLWAGKSEYEPLRNSVAVAPAA
jgi:transposase